MLRLAALRGLFEAVGFAFDLNNLGVVYEPIDEGNNTGGIGENRKRFESMLTFLADIQL